ncbi:MAG: hypothetical protein KC776_38055 [Myxococcales bacterium]|nr:hypothetical protein [Myxococcales bacterium]MCB9579986.1 hypothetical protein [Polyangiaceae bacterium]
MPYRTRALSRQSPPPLVSPPREILDHVHVVFDRFPLGTALLAALLQIGVALALGVLLAAHV